MPQILPQLLISLVVGLVTGAIQAAVAFGSKSLQKKNKRRRVDNKARENKLNITETISDLPVIYGRARIGCSRVFTGQRFAYAGEESFQDNGVTITQSTRGEYLYVINAFCVGEIDDVEQIYLDGLPITDAKYSNGYKVDLAFYWTFAEPSPVSLSTSLSARYGDFVKRGGSYHTARAEGWTQTNPGSLFPVFTKIATYQPDRYFLYKIVGLQKILIVAFKGGTQAASLQSVSYGNGQEYILEYKTDQGAIISVGRAVVNVTQDNVDFVQTVNQNLTVTQNSFLNSEYVYFEEKRGALTQTANNVFLSDGVPGYNANMRGLKVALGYFRFLIRTKGKASENTPIFGLPDTQAVIRGHLILDTRTNVFGYSNNPAMCLRDYLLDQSYYGCKIEASDIDEQSFKDAADYCDELITASNGVTQIKRYVLNGVVDTSQEVIDNIMEILEACNGFLFNDFGKWRMLIEKPETSVWSFDVNNIVESTITLTKAEYRSKLNTINAKFINEVTSWETDVCTVSNPAFITQDGGKVLDAELDLGFTNDYEHAYYIALVKLKSGRTDLTMVFETYWDAFDILPGAVVDITLEHLGFNQKLFRVKEIMPDNETGLLKFTVIEYDPDVYNNLNIDPAANNITSDLPSPFDVKAPSNVQVNQTFATDANGLWNTVTRFSWQPSLSPNVRNYQLELRTFGWNEYEVIGRTEGTVITANNIVPGIYDLRLKAINAIGAQSPYYEEVVEIFAPQDRPPDVEGFQISGSGREFVLKWDLVQQVNNNGFYIVRHSRNVVNANWNDSPTFQLVIPGFQTSATISQIDGTYMIKAVNSAGLESFSEARLTLDSPIDSEFALIQTIAEAPTFAGEIVQYDEQFTSEMQWDGETILWDTDVAEWTENIGTISLFVDNNMLTLAKQFTIDQINPLLTIDELEALNLTIDQWGGNGNYLLGVYNLANSLDLGAVYKVTLESLIESQVVQQSGATIDELEALNITIDDLEAQGNTIDNWELTNNLTVQALVYVRYTRDNPANGAVWTEWQLLTKNEFVCRAAEFKLEVISPDSVTNIWISTLSVKVWMRNRIDQKSTSITSANQQVLFNKSFYLAPSTVNLSIDNPAAGDYATGNLIDRNGFIINVKDNAGSGAIRNVTATAYGVGEQII